MKESEKQLLLKTFHNLSYQDLFQLLIERLSRQLVEGMRKASRFRIQISMLVLCLGYVGANLITTYSKELKEMEQLLVSFPLLVSLAIYLVLCVFSESYKNLSSDCSYTEIIDGLEA